MQYDFEKMKGVEVKMFVWLRAWRSFSIIRGMLKLSRFYKLHFLEKLVLETWKCFIDEKNISSPFITYLFQDEFDHGTVALFRIGTPHYTE